MKKVIALLLAVLMMLSLSACAQKAGQQNIESKAPEEVAQTESEAPAEEAGTDRLAEIKERGYITIATEGNWAPWTYQD